MSVENAANGEKPWWFAAATKSPFKTASLTLLTIGGLVLLAFFVHAGAMPEVSLGDATSILAAVALIGLLVASVVVFPSVTPGLIYGAPDPDQDLLRSRRTLLLSTLPGWVLFLLLSVKVAGDVEPISVSWWPAALLGVSAVCAILAVAFGRRGHRDPFVHVGRFKQAGAAVQLWIKLTLLSGFWTFCASLSMVLLFKIYPGSDAKWSAIAALAAWVFFCSGTNVFLARTAAHDRSRAAVMMACASLGALVTLTGGYAAIPRAAVRALGLGEVPVRIVVTANGCDILNKAMPGRPVCRVASGESTALVCPVILKSRVGNPWLIQFSATGSGGRWPTNKPLPAIPIPKGEVVSWPRLELPEAPKSAASVAAAPAAAGSATTTNAGVAGLASALSYLDRSSAGAATKDWLDRECGPAP